MRKESRGKQEGQQGEGCPQELKESPRLLKGGRVMTPHQAEGRQQKTGDQSGEERESEREAENLQRAYFS